MRFLWRPFASYNLWSLFTPAVGRERFHCPMKRGFLKARKREPEIEALIKRDTIPQTIGILSQRGVYEFHKNEKLLKSPNGVSQVASLIQLQQEAPETQSRVLQILSNYRSNPILVGKELLALLRGDEGPPKPILLKRGHYTFNLYAAFDCVFSEFDGTVHILDFKTGKSAFDSRQAYVYLLAAQYLYPNQKVVASFYNLELRQWSSPITATPAQLDAVQLELMRISQRHQLDLNQYRQNRKDFSLIFPPVSGYPCRSCIFNSVCNFSL